MEKVDVVIETPKGSGQKYTYDSETRFFKLKKTLPAGMVFPYDFGFIPRTKGDDGDPLDIIIISDLCSFPACLIECRVIGGFKAKQTDSKNSRQMIRNDRFIGVPYQSVLYQNIKTIDDLPDEILKELEDFFVNYNKIQNKQFKILARLAPKPAIKIIKENMEK